MSSPNSGLKYLSKDDRLATTKKGKMMYDELKQGRGEFHPFQTQTQLFILCMAVGIIKEEKIEDEKFDEDIIRWETYSNHDPFGIFPLLVKTKYPDLDNNGVARIMERYAEAGLRILYEEFKNTGSIDFQRLIDTSAQAEGSQHY